MRQKQSLQLYYTIDGSEPTAENTAINSNTLHLETTGQDEVLPTNFSKMPFALVQKLLLLPGSVPLSITVTIFPSSVYEDDSVGGIEKTGEATVESFDYTAKVKVTIDEDGKIVTVMDNGTEHL